MKGEPGSPASSPRPLRRFPISTARIRLRRSGATRGAASAAASKTVSSARENARRSA